MSELSRECEDFAGWLLESTESESPAWRDHLERCKGCRAQADAHSMLTSAFAAEPVPELSDAFESRLARRLAPELEIRPLAGWRRAAMVAYIVVSLILLGWSLRAVELPTIDLSAPWVPVAALVAVPLSLMLAIRVSGWLPAGLRPRGPGIVAA